MTTYTKTDIVTSPLEITSFAVYSTDVYYIMYNNITHDNTIYKTNGGASIVMYTIQSNSTKKLNSIQVSPDGTYIIAVMSNNNGSASPTNIFYKVLTTSPYTVTVYNNLDSPTDINVQYRFVITTDDTLYVSTTNSLYNTPRIAHISLNENEGIYTWKVSSYKFYGTDKGYGYNDFVYTITDIIYNEDEQTFYFILPDYEVVEDSIGGGEEGGDPQYIQQSTGLSTISSWNLNSNEVIYSSVYTTDTSGVSIYDLYLTNTNHIYTLINHQNNSDFIYDITTFSSMVDFNDFDPPILVDSTRRIAQSSTGENNDETFYLIRTEQSTSYITKLYNSENELEIGGDPHIKTLSGKHYLLPNENKYYCLLKYFDNFEITCSTNYITDKNINALNIYHKSKYRKYDLSKLKKSHWIFNYTYMDKIKIKLKDDYVIICMDTLTVTEQNNKTNKITINEITPQRGVFSIRQKSYCKLTQNTKQIQILCELDNNETVSLDLVTDMTYDELHNINLKTKNIDSAKLDGCMISEQHIIIRTEL